MIQHRFTCWKVIDRWRAARVMRAMVASAIVATVSICVPAHAVRCGEPGSYEVVRTKDGQHLIFLVSRNAGDVMFALPGTEMQKDTEAPPGNRLQFILDGVHYQYLEAPKSQFLNLDAPIDDAAILAKHAEWERQSLTATHRPLSEFVDFGNRSRAARDDNPAYTFKMWQMQEPGHPNGVRQIFLTTVVGEQVVVLSAIGTDQNQWARVMTTMHMFSDSYALIPERQGCPNATRTHAQ